MNPISLSTISASLLTNNLAATNLKTRSSVEVADVAPNTGNFGNAIEQALRDVSAAQSEATTLSREFQLENPNVSLEETMIAMQKASLGFQSAVQVRNKLVTAYNDIMNMPV